ncbi:LLM class flavin-dependent oxidoreductase [Nocardia tengchongensis]|uniref:LLM class flavin-dependent oxidoreductase n=2 Tax=Nocardia tengchongensis TaxID=2055889 RepID=A0ABX8D205_9NOCA|nr:LLM class flavin-dependent oxidoreductase [Nocardia tengchongensis]
MTNTPGAEHMSWYRAALDMAAYADAHGFTAVACEEHHLARNGWLPSPLILAAAIAGRTHRVRINVSALLVPLYDPVRLAEDIAVLDNLSGGRFSFVAGMGYREAEYRALDRQWAQRGKTMDACLDILTKAWSGEPFERNGHTVQVTPQPFTKPHPIMFIGGMSAAAARRAARYGLPFYPPMPMPKLEQLYRDELLRHGTSGFVYRPARGNTTTLVHPDPDTAWRELGPHLLTEAAEYASWKTGGVPRPNEDIITLDELRHSGAVEILTPEQCLAAIATGVDQIVINPLAGGIPPDQGWKMLRLFTEQVLPAIGPEPADHR